MTIPNIILIGTQGAVPRIIVKSVYWGLKDVEHPIHTKFNISDCIRTINVIPKIILDESQGSVRPI